MILPALGHAFGARYELPIPLFLFVFGGALVVFLSFLLVVRRETAKEKRYQQPDVIHQQDFSWPWAILSFVLLAGLILAGIFGSQEVPENILPTVFWVLIWVAVPLACGLIGDWTQKLNPFSNIAKLANSKQLRQSLLGNKKELLWPRRLGWWPAVVLLFALGCGELIFNQTATKPAVIAAGLLAYFFVSALAGLFYGLAWLQKGEVFSALFSTWGRLGYFRFGAAGRQGFAGGLAVPFEASYSRNFFVLLLLVTVSFDGLISTPFWNRFHHNLPSGLESGLAYQALATVVFAGLALLIWGLFSVFAAAVVKAGGRRLSHSVALAGLLPSLLPISFGYLLAHYLEYLVVNTQLLFPLLGNPIGKESWPIHLPHPFNDTFEVHIHVLPSSFYWYAAVIVIIAVHVTAVFLAHRHLISAAKNSFLARRSEYPWVIAMVAYTMLSLWLLAQPLVKEKPAAQAEHAIGRTVAIIKK